MVNGGESLRLVVEVLERAFLVVGVERGGILVGAVGVMKLGNSGWSMMGGIYGEMVGDIRALCSPYCCAFGIVFMYE